MAKTLKILITGAARGIGLATAQVLAKRGHSVVATDVSAWSGLEGIQAHVLDVTSDDSVARCLEEVGPLDAVVNNAGITSGGGPVEGYPLGRFRQIVRDKHARRVARHPGGLARLAKAGFRRHRECIEYERPSPLAVPGSRKGLQVRP